MIKINVKRIDPTEFKMRKCSKRIFKMFRTPAHGRVLFSKVRADLYPHSSWEVLVDDMTVPADAVRSFNNAKLKKKMSVILRLLSLGHKRKQN